MIFLTINLPNFVQFKQYWGKSGPRVLLFKARHSVLKKNIVDDQGFGNCAHGMVVQPAVQCRTCVQFAREYRERVQ